jgi:hypothetical protein
LEGNLSALVRTTRTLGAIVTEAGEIFWGIDLRVNKIAGKQSD